MEFFFNVVGGDRGGGRSRHFVSPSEAEVGGSQRIVESGQVLVDDEVTLVALAGVGGAFKLVDPSS